MRKLSKNVMRGKGKPCRTTVLSAAITLLFAPELAFAQAEPSGAGDATTLDTMVVSGTAAGAVRKLEASFNVISVNAEQIKVSNPKSTADLFKISPGIWPESTGGQTGANIGVAGFPTGCCLQSYVSILLNGSPLYGSTDDMATADMFRVDDTIEAMEILQGGPSVVFADGQMGATANFFLKTGTEQPSGSIGLTWGNEGLWRIDGFSGFKVGKQWYGSIGGFWRESDGVRSPQFKADKGGQLTATLSRDFDAGKLTLYARHLNDKNQFIVPIPMIETGTGKFRAHPNFNPLTGAYGSNALRRLRMNVHPGGPVDADLANGRGVRLSMFGGDFEYETDHGWKISDSFIHNGGEYFMNALFSRSNPTTLRNMLYDSNVIGWLDVPLTAQVDANYTTGGAVAMDDEVIQQGWWRQYIRVNSFSNDFRLSRDLFEGNTLTAGVYVAHYTMDETRSRHNWMLMSNEPNARPVTVRYVDGGQTYLSTDTQGIANFAGSLNRSNFTQEGESTNLAVYLSDSWRIGQWLFDLSGRVERKKGDISICNIAPVNPGSGGLDGNLNTLYDNDVGMCDGTFTRYTYQKTHQTWTAGANYIFSNHFSAYARANTGALFPGVSVISEGDRPPMLGVRNYEAGFKYQSSWIYADISTYRRDFTGLVYRPTDNNGVRLGSTAIYGSETFGVNLVSILTPVKNLSLNVLANYMDGKYVDYDACVPYVDINNTNRCAVIQGQPLQRQPKTRVVLTPSYRFETNWGDVTPWVTYNHIGKHTSGESGLQQLGSYHFFDIGLTANAGEHWQFNLRGTNMTNEIGVTEGNPRVFGAGATSDGVVLVRPMEGREVNFQVKYLW